MSFLELLTSLSPVLKDAVMTAVAAIGAWVAISGLNSWKRQLRGKTEYELARSLLKGALQVRNRLSSVRSPFFPQAEGEHGAFEGMKQAFEIRLNGVGDAWIELETGMLEAEVLWGDSASQVFDKLKKCHGQLVARVGEYLWVENPNPPPWVTVDRNAARVDRVRKVVLALDPDDDPYWGSVTDAIEEIRNYVRPYLQ